MKPFNYRFLVFSMSLYLLSASGLVVAKIPVKPLYETSFESERVGPYKSLGGGGHAKWTSRKELLAVDIQAFDLLRVGWHEETENISHKEGDRETNKPVEK